MLGQAPLELTWLLYNPISRVIGELPLWSVLCHHSLSSCQSCGLLHWKGQRVSMGVLGCDIWFLEYSLHFQSGKSVLEVESPISSFPTCGIRTFVITGMTEGSKSRWSIQANPLQPKELPRRENPQTSYKVSGRPTDSTSSWPVPTYPQLFISDWSLYLLLTRVALGIHSNYNVGRNGSYQVHSRMASLWGRPMKGQESSR